MQWMADGALACVQAECSRAQSDQVSHKPVHMQGTTRGINARPTSPKQVLWQAKNVTQDNESGRIASSPRNSTNKVENAAAGLQQFQ